MSRPIVTLLTDFGLRDTFVGQMKGVIWGRAPEAAIVDLTHEIPPGDIAAGLTHLMDAYRTCPAGTIHVAVVDPDVGTGRNKPCVVAGDGHLFVGPDNGLFGFLFDRGALHAAHELVNPEARRGEVSSTFHGRDIYAPAAAWMASGRRFDLLGPPLASIKRLRLALARHEATLVRGQVVWVDRFGNVASSIVRADGDALSARVGPAHFLAARVGDDDFPLVESYGAVEEGQVCALWNSSGRLELAVNRGRADERLGLSPGDAVTLVAV